jgi:hypothetical protein
MRPALLVTGTNTLISLSHSFLGAFAKCEQSNYYLRNVCLSVQPSTWSISASCDWILKEFDISVLFENLSRKLKFNENVITIMVTVYEDMYIYYSKRKS